MNWNPEPSKLRKPRRIFELNDVRVVRHVRQGWNTGWKQFDEAMKKYGQKLALAPKTKTPKTKTMHHAQVHHALCTTRHSNSNSNSNSMTLNNLPTQTFDINPNFDKTPWVSRANQVTHIAFVHTPSQVDTILDAFYSDNIDNISNSKEQNQLNLSQNYMPFGIGQLFHPPYLHNLYGRKELLYGFKKPKILLIYDSSTLNHLILIGYSQKINPFTSLSTAVNILRPWLHKLPPTGPYPPHTLSPTLARTYISNKSSGSIVLSDSSRRSKRARTGQTSPNASLPISQSPNSLPQMDPNQSRIKYSWTTDARLFRTWVELNRKQESQKSFEPPGTLIHSYLLGDSPFTVPWPSPRSKEELKALIPSIPDSSAAKLSAQPQSVQSFTSDQEMNRESDIFLSSVGDYSAMFSRICTTSSIPLSDSIHPLSFHVYRADFKDESVLSYHQRIRLFSILAIEIGEYIDFSDEMYNDWEILFCFAKFKHPESNSFGFSLVSYVTYFSYHGYPNSTLRISQMVCLPPFQKQGHGAQLLTALYRDSVIRGFDWVTVYDASEQFRLLRDVTDFRLLVSKGFFRSGLGPPSNLFDCKPKSQRELEDIARKTGITPPQILRIYEILLLAHVISSIVQNPSDTDPIVNEILQEHPDFLKYSNLVKQRIHTNYLQGISDTNTIEKTLEDLWQLHLSDYEDILDKLYSSSQLPNYSDPRWVFNPEKSGNKICHHPSLTLNTNERPPCPVKPRTRITTQEKWWEYRGETTSDDESEEDIETNHTVSTFDAFVKSKSKQINHQNVPKKKKSDTIADLINVRDYHFETFSPSSEDEETDESSKLLKFWKVKFIDRTNLN